MTRTKRNCTISDHHHHQGQQAAFSLLDIPDSWLVQWLQCDHLDAESKQAVASTCRALLRMALDTHTGTTRLCIDLSLPKEPPSAVASAMFQHQVLGSSKRVSLEVTSSSMGMLHPTGTVAPMGSVSSMFHLQCSLMQGPLSHVTSLTMQIHSARQMFHPSMFEACPNMTHLDVSVANCDFNTAYPFQDWPAHISLQSLHVNFGEGLTDESHWGAAVELHDVVQHLPALTALEISAMHWPAQEEFLWQALAPVSGQLTSFTFNPAIPHAENPQMDGDLPSILGTFKHLQYLSLPGVCVKDKSMHMLMQLRSLTRLVVGAFHLASSFKTQECSWEQVHVLDRISFTSFGFVPTKCLQCMWVGDAGAFKLGVLYPQDQPADIAASMDVLSKVGCIHTLTPEIEVYLCTQHGELYTEGVCEALLCAIGQLRGEVHQVTLHLEVLSNAVLNALATSLPASVHTVHINYTNELIHGESLPSLPMTLTHLELNPMFPMGASSGRLQQVWVSMVPLCCAAWHPLTITLHMPRRLGDSFWHSVILEAMAQAGHLNVTLCYQDNNMVFE